MRKLFMFLAVAGLATFGASCSKSDNSKPDPDKKQLSISASPNGTIEEGTSVTFTAKVDGKEESGAEFHVDGKKVANPYKFEKEGSYKVVAKKSNFNDSNAITITVTKKGEPGVKSLVLTGPSEAKVGADVTFVVKDNNGASVGGYKLMLNGAEVANPWKATAGVHKFKATKADYTDSNEVTVTVTVDQDALTLTLVTPAADVKVGAPFRLRVTNAAGPVANAELYVGESPIGDGNGGIALTDDKGEMGITAQQAGTYPFTAKKDGKVSNEVAVVVQPKDVPSTTLSGTYVYNGTTYNVKDAFLVFLGLDQNPTTKVVYAVWSVEAEDATNADNAALIQFSTPAKPSTAQPGYYEYDLPTATNTTAMFVGIWAVDKVIDSTTSGISLALNVAPNSDASVFHGTCTSGATLSSKPFSLNLTGDFLYINGSSSAASFAKSKITKASSNLAKVTVRSSKVTRLGK